MNQDATQSVRDSRFLIFASAFFFLWYLGLYFVFETDGFSEQDELYTYALFFLSAPVCALIAALWKPLQSTSYQNWPLSNNVTALLGIALPLMIIVWGLKGIDITLYHTEYETPVFSSIRFAIGAVGMLSASIAAVFLHQKVVTLGQSASPLVAPWARTLGYVAGFMLILSLFDINITVDTLSYDPYIGPAAAVLEGAIPLVDVFSQYGLNFLVFSAALAVLPWSLFSTTLVVALLNTAYYLVVCLIALRMTRNRLSCFLLSVFIVMFLQTASLYNITYTPSVLAMRFLPPLLLILALAHLPKGRWFSAWSSGSMVLCSLWSIEALAFGLVSYAAYIFILGISLRKYSLTKPAVAFAQLTACVVVPHILLSAGYWIFFNQLPRYDIYWELVTSSSTAESKNFSWQLPINPEIRTWVLFGFPYALCLAYTLFNSWRSEDKHGEAPALALIGALCTLGIVQFFYYVGRSATPVLVLLAFPLAILFVLAFDKTWSSLQRTIFETRINLFPAVFGLLLVAGMSGVFADRFFRPMTVTGSNSTILRSCLSDGDLRICKPNKIVKSLWRKMQEPVGFPANYPGAGGWSPQENEQAYALVQKHLKAEPKVFLFIADSAAVLFFTRKTNGLGLTHSMVDGRSPTLVARALRAVDNLTEGTIVIVGDTRSSKTDEQILTAMRERWLFCPLESKTLVSAYQLQEKVIGRCDGALVKTAN
jgi:hypothetical protein